MMAWHRFMQSECLHFPLRSRFQIVGVRIKITRAPGIDRARLIVGGRLGLLGKSGDRDDTVRHPRKGAEQLWQLRIDSLGNVPVSQQEQFLVLEKELRIGAQEVEKGLEVAMKLGPAHRLFHLRADSLDLGQPDLVDLVRGEVGGGHRLDPDRVPASPSGNEEIPTVFLAFGSYSLRKNVCNLRIAGTTESLRADLPSSRRRSWSATEIEEGIC